MRPERCRQDTSAQGRDEVSLGICLNTFGRRCGTNDPEAFRVLFSQRQVGVTNPPKEFQLLGLEPVWRAAARCPGQRGLGIKIE